MGGASVVRRAKPIVGLTMGECLRRLPPEILL
ncbi:hypothetical protein MB901379_03412 [Mycobacterium basiliense]|uniref:Uncharacterized protein n=1 Tax=Mycobacterium basiliense TaxID=2094119 RepID=A0A3S5CZY4_9MYCO|nr:hypothetical protein MB901379_03412 [Mycobacterium basiliense]